jgi:hypothetical protein
MGYVGNQTTNSYSSFDKQDLTGVTGSPAKRGFTLSHAVANAQEIEVFVNNVRQEPGEAYTVSGTGLTMTGDVETTDDFYVVFQGKALQTIVPPDGSVTSAKLDTNIDIAGTLDSTGIITADAGIKLNLNSATVTGQTVTTNTLTDFEQGTWTPTSAYGTVTANYAFYVKVGNMVTVWTQLQSFSDSSSNGIYVEGLPYASASGFFGTGFVMHRYVNIGNEDDLSVYIANSASNFRLFKIRANGAWSTLTYSLLSTNHQFYITFSYLTG